MVRLGRIISVSVLFSSFLMWISEPISLSEIKIIFLPLILAVLVYELR